MDTTELTDEPTSAPDNTPAPEPSALASKPTAPPPLHFEQAVEAKPPESDCAARTNCLRNQPKISPHEKSQNVFTFIYSTLKDRGSFHYDHQTSISYYFDRRRKRVTAIHKDDLNFRALMRLFALNPSEKIYQYLNSALAERAYSESAGGKICRGFYYDSKTNALKVFNNDAAVFELTVDSVKTVDNGASGILFLNYPDAEKIEVSDDTGTHATDTNA